jgi:hypothetical protein
MQHGGCVQDEQSRAVLAQPQVHTQGLALSLQVVKTFRQRLDFFKLVGKTVEDFHDSSYMPGGRTLAMNLIEKKERL